MIVTVKIILAIALILIIFQDIKDRRVWAFLFPIVATFGSYLFYRSMSVLEYYLYSLAINAGIIVCILGVLFLIGRAVSRKRTFFQMIGLGDILFFFAFAMLFPTVTFLNFFVFSILFTIIFHQILKRVNTKHIPTIPLAGSMSLFLLMVYLVHWTGLYEKIYLI
ncbi:MAG: hypothetical protein CMC35_09610 [Flavobacteriaceae bacterium]|mgnify:CR=1 FL=1|nr:hypothetical protein [Flavobacteriaceae bacterium]